MIGKLSHEDEQGHYGQHGVRCGIKWADAKHSERRQHRLVGHNHTEQSGQGHTKPDGHSQKQEQKEETHPQNTSGRSAQPLGRKTCQRCNQYETCQGQSED